MRGTSRAIRGWLMKAMNYRILAQKSRGKRRITDRRPVKYSSRSRSMRGSSWNMRETQETKKITRLGWSMKSIPKEWHWKTQLENFKISKTPSIRSRHATRTCARASLTRRSESKYSKLTLTSYLKPKPCLRVISTR